MVEFRPSKPAVRVRSPSPAPLKIKDYVVIIAKRIHLFPFRTQKLSSLALMVLGGQPPGRVRRSHVIFFYFINYLNKKVTRGTNLGKVLQVTFLYYLLIFKSFINLSSLLIPSIKSDSLQAKETLIKSSKPNAIPGTAATL